MSNTSKKKKEPVYTLTEFSVLRSVKSGEIAGLKLWGNTEPKSLENWDATLTKFRARKLKK